MSQLKHLNQRSCEACRADAPRLTINELDALRKDIPGWSVIDADGVQQLKKVFAFHDFIQALDFARVVGEVAEQEGHHPALLVEWGRVTVYWWSHRINGLHENDVIMAAKTDALFLHGGSP